jgi:hypothetical protein
MRPAIRPSTPGEFLFEEGHMKVWPRRGGRLVLLLGIAPFLHGCMTTSGDGPVRPWGESGVRLKREAALRAAWRGRPYQSLLEAFGTPRMVMNVPGYRVVKTEVVVYGTVDKVSNCIDAFTVIHPGSEGDLMVSDYFCR